MTLRARPAVIAVGGPPGAGKTALTARLSAEFGIPRLGSDAIGQIIKGSEGAKCASFDAYWIAYDVVFGLCAEFLSNGVSAILDLNLGWEFQWRQLERLRVDYPEATVLPIVLRCPWELCLARIQRRHDGAPEEWGPPERYLANEAIVGVWDYHERLERPDTHFIDAARSEETVFADTKGYVVARLKEHGCMLGRDAALDHEGLR